jgi:hypothetical protein
VKGFKTRCVLSLVSLAVGFQLVSQLIAPSRAQAGSNPLFGYTHLLPSPFTLPAGRFVFGTDIALGITDFFQVGTNLLRNFYQVYNANAKVSLVDYPVFALALTGGWESYNYKDISPLNPDLRIQSWLPGMVMAFEVMPKVALFTGANLNLSQVTLQTSGVQTSGYIRGSTVQSDISWAYNPPKKKGLGNVLSGGVSYDINYALLGVGLSHHWSGFHFGLHYYPNADRYKVQPILSGGGAVDL